jgi:hypothetical protein
VAAQQHWVVLFGLDWEMPAAQQLQLGGTITAREFDRWAVANDFGDSWSRPESELAVLGTSTRQKVMKALAEIKSRKQKIRVKIGCDTAHPPRYSHSRRQC